MRSHPKKNNPTKVDSRKNAINPSIANGAPKNVADIVRVIGPVGAKLKFHGDAGRHPHGEVDAEQLAPEPRHVAPDLTARHHVSALHDSEQKRQPERQRHEQKVIESRHRELKARQAYRIDMVHGDLFLSFTATTTGRARG